MSRQSTPDIMCWQHCDKLTNILCFSVPPVCPLCHYNTTHSPSRIPLTNSPPPHQCWRVTSVTGSQANSWNFSQGSKVFWSTPIPTNQWQISLPTLIKTSLPIPWCMGIRVDQKSLASEGTVYDYDEDGVHVGVAGWEECLVIPLSNRGVTPQIYHLWDSTLQNLSQSNMWTKLKYIEDRHNCFDFVIFFLKQVGFSRQNLSAESRSALTHDIILPQMSKVVQYITLYRNVASFSYVCQDVQTKSLMKSKEIHMPVSICICKL